MLFRSTLVLSQFTLDKMDGLVLPHEKPGVTSQISGLPEKWMQRLSGIASDMDCNVVGGPYIGRRDPLAEFIRELQKISVCVETTALRMYIARIDGEVKEAEVKEEDSEDEDTLDEHKYDDTVAQFMESVATDKLWDYFTVKLCITYTYRENDFTIHIKRDSIECEGF